MDYICHCFQVTSEEIIQIILDKSLTTLEELQEHCSAGKGCRGCTFEELPKLFGELGKS